MGSEATENAPAQASPSDRPPAHLSHFSKRSLAIAAAFVVAVVIIFVVLHYHRRGDQRRYEALLKASLDKIVTAEEGYYYDSTRYVSSLGALPTVQLPAGVHVTLFNPDRRSWWGIATHDRLPGRHCIVWVGTAPTSLPLEARAPENETKPLCFNDGQVVVRQSRSS